MNIRFVPFALFLALLLPFAPAARAQLSDCDKLLRRHFQPPPFSPDQIHEVLSQIQRYWNREFAKRGLYFPSIKYVVYKTALVTGCGPVPLGKGAFFCSVDQTVYLDPYTLSREESTVGSPTPMLLVYILAHEVGHLVQARLGIFERGERFALFHYGYAANDYFFPRLEFQADCLAGVVLRDLHEQGFLSDRHIVEALDRMTFMGDDAQSMIARSLGFIPHPPPYSHGTSRERMHWLANGLDGGHLESCETWDFPSLRIRRSP